MQISARNQLKARSRTSRPEPSCARSWWMLGGQQMVAMISLQSVQSDGV